MVRWGARWLGRPMSTVGVEPPFEAALRLAERQFGLIGDRQLPGLGIDRRRWVRAVDSRHWLPMSHRVWRRTGAPCTDDTCAMAVVLHHGDGAAISHQSAAALWGGARVSPVADSSGGASCGMGRLGHDRTRPAGGVRPDAACSGLPGDRPSAAGLATAPRRRTQPDSGGPAVAARAAAGPSRGASTAPTGVRPPLVPAVVVRSDGGGRPRAGHGARPGRRRGGQDDA